ncbi:hypothetical protein BCR33DRAFT_532999 [Rhizoclosmatium globosum]|uniref:Uncharacterized protein n=1 Tax=Rhizoclosmatium globosum TaxID=329046 RepID=A0A1Y2BD14_9FUNG|nr:hypothetical protein BCR33DRAFT_532999 [Rhizoclosmatium globosum]|eukprot:ORY32711.1 hypothetical protein BCR33DRAFT_532999 [Rhizoclosmatium globosum]
MNPSQTSPVGAWGDTELPTPPPVASNNGASSWGAPPKTTDLSGRGWPAQPQSPSQQQQQQSTVDSIAAKVSTLSANGSYLPALTTNQQTNKQNSLQIRRCSTTSKTLASCR